MKITGAIFDLDGTLLNSMDYWGQVAGELLLELGLSTQDNTNRRFLEMGMKAWHSWCVENLGLEMDYDSAKKYIYDHMNKKYESEVVLKDGARELLEALKSAGVKMCLATATDRETVEMILDRLDIKKYFSRIFTCGEVGVGKREPLIYNLALEHLGTPKETTYVFEDAHYALKTAHENGFNTVCIYDKNVFVPKQEMIAIADIYLDECDRYKIDIE